MNPLTKSKIAAYLAIIFVAGGIAGTVLAWGSAKRNMLRPATPEKICHAMQARLKSKLDLTPEQLVKIQPILDRITRDIETIHAKTVEKIDQTIRKANEEIALVLTEEQKKKLQELENDRCRFTSKKTNGPGEWLRPQRTE